MIHYFWLKSMATAGFDPREKTHEELIEHPEKLELFILEEAVKKDKPRVVFSEKDTKISRKERAHDRKGEQDQKARSSGQNSCEPCKMMKCEDNSTWKTHNTRDYRSKKYYKKRISDSSDRSESDYEKSRRATTRKLTKSINLQLEKRLTRHKRGVMLDTAVMSPQIVSDYPPQLRILVTRTKG